MGYISTWKNARELGKTSMEKSEKKNENVEIELKSVNVTDESKHDDVNEDLEISTDGKVNAVDHKPTESSTSPENPSS